MSPKARTNWNNRKAVATYITDAATRQPTGFVSQNGASSQNQSEHMGRTNEK